MGIKKIFAEKSATLYSQYPYLNSGQDEILEISNELNLLTSSQNLAEVSRALIHFSTSSVSTLFNSISASNYKIYLRLFLADTSDIPLNYTLFAHKISGSYNIGTGRSSNLPQTQDGVSWKLRSSTEQWNTSSFSNSTASYQSTFGGGVWFTGSNNVSSQSFTNVSDKDILIDVTNIISASIPQDGFIIKNSGSIEFSTGSLVSLKYFSGNTHTIYPPCLEFRYNDHTYTTGSSTVVSDDQTIVTLRNNKGSFQNNSIQTFRIFARDKYPTRVFQTSSLYTSTKILPSQSYWSIKDLYTEETVVDFDDNYTVLNCDGTSSYFNLSMDFLEPERFYKILVKSVIGSETLIFDSNYNFKVVR